MTSSTSAQYPAAEINPCRIAPIGQGNQVRPKLPLLKVLRVAGARGETFTLKEVMHYLGQYIMLKQLYDKQQQHIVHCGDDELGLLLGIQSFSVKDPSPLYDMLRKNLTATASADAAQALTLTQDQSIGNPSQDQPKRAVQGGFPASEAAGDGDAAVLSGSQLKRQHSEEDDGLMEGQCQPQSKQPRLDLVFEEWDVAGLPWWFVGNLRNNYEPLSNGSTDIPTNQDIDTAVVSDSTDDLWFLNESESEKFSMEVKMESRDSEEESEEGGGGGEGKDGKEVIKVTVYEDELDDTQCLSDDADPDDASEDCWQCTKCKKFNSPIKRYCFRCWALRKDWYADCPKLLHSLSTSNISSKLPKKDDDKGIDIPDCRRTISAPIVRPRDSNAELEKPRLTPHSSIESLDLAESTLSSLTASKSPRQESAELHSDAVVSLESSKELLEPCRLCQRRPRNGNIVHGRTAHLVTCFLCAKMLQKGRLPCPVCKKQIHMVVKIFVA
ncbi:protein Mdm4 isoform X2 [Rhinatrema bivittatum]|uniref:protein Mdm4 isoform X2 n=1 Tax=Rhinatrema bivittatum TaxID=194408 RepID=UPI00112641FD|nr:protein Mdm4 isoform X2 [Rhinatrema bivittatum]